MPSESDVWWPLRPTAQYFNEDIQPEIEKVLDGLELSCADIFIRLLMLGPTLAKATPTIAVFCTDDDTLHEVENRIRASGLLDRLPGFNLRTRDIPVDGPIPRRRDFRDYTRRKTEELQQPRLPQDLEIHAQTSKPELGRLLHFRRPGCDGALHSSAGGVVLELGEEYYQLTSGYFGERDTDPDPAPAGTSSHGVDESHGNVSEYDADDEYCPSEKMSDDETPDIFPILSAETLEAMRISDDESETSDSESDSESDTPLLSCFELIHEGHVKQDLTVAVCSSQDWSLIKLQDSQVQDIKDGLNRVEPDKFNCENTLYVRDTVTTDSTDRYVVAATSMRGPLKGYLLHGAVIYRARNKAKFQTLYQAAFRLAPYEGDGGSPVLNAETGNLYGHLILGGGQSVVAYYVPADDVLQDIKKVTGITPVFPDGRKLENEAHDSTPSSEEQA
ncbi:hypothetical protein F4677DRAFT_446433 [Hypoxylon crocopeplum]|nr:hypothetical protein F4677DRAFT_446433 [Hypoxylon crocopeplum]